jgi:acid phosphatase (class A)
MKSMFSLATIAFLIFSVPAKALEPKGLFYNLPGPPARGDAQDQIDYQTLLDYQSNRTKAECDRAASEVKVDLSHFFAAPYGPLNPGEAAKWQAFVDRHSVRAFLTMAAAKLQYHRPRPFQSHLDLHPCIALEKTYSYPSGHSAFAEYYGKILAIAFPERAKILSERATQIALDRSLGGVHYPTDVRDGLSLGDQIFDAENEDGELEKEIHENFL